MCKLTLNAVVTRALVDAEFRRALLSGQAGQALGEFPLREEERQVLGSIRADSIEGFVAQVHRLMEKDPGVGLPAEMMLPSYPTPVYATAGAG